MASSRLKCPRWALRGQFKGCPDVSQRAPMKHAMELLGSTWTFMYTFHGRPCPTHSKISCPVIWLCWNLSRMPMKGFIDFHHETFYGLPRASLDMMSWLSMKRFMFSTGFHVIFHEIPWTSVEIARTSTEFYESSMKHSTQKNYHIDDCTYLPC